jgi:hypothetical protein
MSIHQLNIDTPVNCTANSINIDTVIEHLEKLIVSPAFDPYSEHVLKQTIIMLEHFEELLFEEPEVS